MRTESAVALPAGVHVIERGWLSSNMVLLFDGDGAGATATLVDSGYVKHAPMTVELVRDVLAHRGLPDSALRTLVNTHLHSDHCGGNASIAREFGARILVPAPEFDAVQRWDEEALTYTPTGQRCERFRADGAVSAGDWLEMGGARWHALAAPGHDPHSLILHCPELRGLISADALWETGFGVIFPELEGESGFAEQHAVLELIGSLDVDWVVPGHGPVFFDAKAAVHRAFSRLEAMRHDPARHARNALKVLVKYQLLDLESTTLAQLVGGMRNARIMVGAAGMLGMTLEQGLEWAVHELVKQHKLRLEGDVIHDHD